MRTVDDGILLMLTIARKYLQLRSDTMNQGKIQTWERLTEIALSEFVGNRHL